ncbi:MAG: AbrB/MazE/SpoVT family DNA-binding domain-containing protein [Acidobacteria bacterium]|nr:AbrB/MazE/SpoVT family DNA-binding domain-containing protein [Acidobacteriota bacterium]
MNTTTVVLDNAGRVVIPKTLRDELHLEPGDTLELEFEGERVTLRPVRSSAPLRKERGIWVFRTGRKLSAAAADKVLSDVREERDRDYRGNMR